MKVQVNRVEIELPASSTVKDAIEKSEAPYHTGSIVALVKDVSRMAKETDSYIIQTNKGNLKIKLKPAKLADYWKKNYKQFEGTQLIWRTKDVLALGHTTTNFTPRIAPQAYKQWDVFFGLSGFESDKTDLMFSTSDHTGTYGEPEKGVFAKLVGGKNILSLLTDDDRIEKITPMLEGTKQTTSEPVKLETVLRGGEHIVTYLEINLGSGPQESVEYALAALENDVARTSNTAYAFTQLKGIKDLTLPQENNQAHTRGTLTVRNAGINTGELYIYKEHRLPTNSHNVVGTITHGLELADLAEENQTITIKTIPERVMVLGLTQKQAEEELEKRGITQERGGKTGDDSIVIKQEPLNTLSVLETKSLTTIGVSPEDVVKVELYYDKAPDTIQYFKLMCGLLDKPVGNMRVFYNNRDIGITLFKPNVKLFNRAIIQENILTECVKAFEIGITNMSRKNLGMIGLRDKDDTVHGPTGEEFPATNIIGRITEGFDVITKSKADQMVYLQVINKPEI